MFKKFTNGCVQLVNRWLPDPFIFCIILTIIVFVAAIPATGALSHGFGGILTLVENGWMGGVWSLLAFSMQMALVLVLGNAFASAPIIKKFLHSVAGTFKTPTAAIIGITAISTIACWINWGFGLVVGALLAKEIARQVKGVDYRLLMAAAYSGFVVWHAGFSGSIPLQIASGFTFPNGVEVPATPIAQTIFSPWNIAMCLVILVGLPFILAKAHPSPEETISVDPALLADEEFEFKKPETPAEKMEYNVVLSGLIVVAGLVGLVLYFMHHGADINLNIVNFIFLILGIAAHKTPIAYVKAIESAAKGAAGIILQFPFYAGIMGLMTFAFKDADGAVISGSLAGVISDFFVAISNRITFPIFTFLSAGVVNFFVPSGGGQWTVQGPIMMPAGEALGVSPAVTGMAIAWGDAWTNMVQPFWALPALGIAGLSARDIMGYCILTLIFSGIVVCGGFIIVGLLTA
ncbi:MAG: short-chain fatty acid transporter [Eubacterium sp.]|nr:short-chain fatty acid transporter [Eubacterium sp.]